MPLQNNIWREDITPEEKAEAEKKLTEWFERFERQVNENAV